MLRSIFMGTPEFAIPSLEATALYTKLLAVYTQPDRKKGRKQELTPPPIKVASERLGIPVFQPESLEHEKVKQEFMGLGADVAIVVGYGKILKSHYLSALPHGFVNLHASLLPRWRGASPIQSALWAGDVETGLTTMKIIEKLDAGPILLQSAIKIDEMDTFGTLSKKLSLLAGPLLKETLERLEKKSLFAIEQDESKASYAKKILAADEKCDLSKNPDALLCQIRALSPYPGAYVESTEQKRLKIFKASVQNNTKEPSIRGAGIGMVLAEKGGLFLQYSHGRLRLDEIQIEGKNVQAGNTVAPNFQKQWILS